MSNLLFTIICFLFSTLYPIPFLFSGWLLWESVEFIPPHKNEKTVKNLNSVISKIPQTALNKKNQSIDITILFVSRQQDIHRFLNEIGWQEISPDIMKSISDALKEISSGRQPAKFPPARKWFIENRKQDISFVKHFKDKRVELYIWRSPFKVTDSPLWYGTIAGIFYKTKSKETKLLTSFHDEIKKFANAHKKIKIRSVQRQTSQGKKIQKKNLLILEIPPDYSMSTPQVAREKCPVNSGYQARNCINGKKQK